MTDLMTLALVRKAPGCPHYITESRYAEMAAIVGESAVGTIRCRFCYDGPVVRFGRFGISGRTNRTPRATPARELSRGELKDQMLYGRAS